MTTTKMTGEQLVEKYQCPGCVCGSSPSSCTAYKPSPYPDQVGCDGHVPGTTFIPGGRMMLGMPKGFNKVGELQEGDRTPVRIWSRSDPGWDLLNVPVWAWDDPDTGTRFVRTFLPRLNVGYVDIIPKPGDWPRIASDTATINIARLLDEID